MSHNWDSSRRPKDPPGWQTLRAQVINKAGGICQHESGCALKGSDVDHIVNLAQGGSHDLNNLQLLCSWHHKEKTAKESAEARRGRPTLSEYRQREAHPGLIG
jgi:5-methylcytosine-specific restriction enzyme A